MHELTNSTLIIAGHGIRSHGVRDRLRARVCKMGYIHPWYVINYVLQCNQRLPRIIYRSCNIGSKGVNHYNIKHYKIEYFEKFLLLGKVVKNIIFYQYKSIWFEITWCWPYPCLPIHVFRPKIRFSCILELIFLWGQPQFQF